MKLAKWSSEGYGIAESRLPGWRQRWAGSLTSANTQFPYSHGEDRRRRGEGDSQRQEGEEAAHHLLVPAVTAAQQDVPEDPVPRPAGACRVGRQAGTHTDTGEEVVTL